MENVLEQIHESGLKFLAPLTPEETYKTIAEEALHLVNADYASIFLDTGGTLEKVYASSSIIEGIKIRPKGFTYQAFISGEPHVVSEEELKKIHPEKAKLDIRSTILIPLTYKSKAIGVLTVDAKKSEYFSDKEFRVLKLFGSMATLAIRKTQLYDETKKALELRDLFISIASHELRTPLTSLNGYIQLLYSRMAKSDTAEAGWVKELYAESNRLTGLVSELLEINRIKQGQLQFIFRETHMGEVIEKAVERRRFMDDEHTIEIQNKVKPHDDVVIGDFDKLLQVVNNLINNACKFSPIGSKITISLTPQKQMLQLQVTDEGEGINPQDLPKIFEEFYKGVNSLRDQKEGLGMGLILAKHIMAAHKGTIVIKSAEGKGTIVEVKIPRMKSAL